MVRQVLRDVYRRVWVLPRIRRTYSELSIAETFQRIYRTKSWGDDGTPFSSGSGSRGSAAQQYCDFVTQFIRDHRVQTVLDLGCGDFAVGSRIVQATHVDYIGIDVVPELIEHHKNSAAGPNIRFQCADVTRDPLPKTDLCLVRQVLQHLSNAEIRLVLANLRGYKNVLISEDVPVRPRSVNRDKPHGPDVRGYDGSGVWVEHPPFNVPISQVHEIPLSRTSCLRTVLLAGHPEGTGD